jgi:hypothetical protein
MSRTPTPTAIIIRNKHRRQKHFKNILKTFQKLKNNIGSRKLISLRTLCYTLSETQP